MDNGVAKSMFVGMKRSDATSGLNGKPLESAPYYKGTGPHDTCDYYRGIRLHGISSIEATGTIWRLCFGRGKLAVREPVCPIDWKSGEFKRYVKAKYDANPRDCKL